MSCHIHYRERQRSRLLLTLLAAAALAALLVADLTTGSSGMSAKDVIAAVAAGPASTEPNAVIVWSLRLPMALTALLVGASLSLAGLSSPGIAAKAVA